MVVEALLESSVMRVAIPSLLRRFLMTGKLELLSYAFGAGKLSFRGTHYIVAVQLEYMREGNRRDQYPVAG